MTLVTLVEVESRIEMRCRLYLGHWSLILTQIFPAHYPTMGLSYYISFIINFKTFHPQTSNRYPPYTIR